MTMHGARRGSFPWSWFLISMAILVVTMIVAVTIGIHVGVLR